MGKKFLIFLVSACTVTILCLVISFYVVFYSRWFPAVILSKVLHHPNVTIESFYFRQRYVHFFDKKSLCTTGFDGVEMSLKTPEDRYAIHIQHLQFQISPHWADSKEILVIIEKLSVVGKILEIKNVFLNLKMRLMRPYAFEITGDLQSPSLTYKPYVLSQLRSKIEGNEKQIHFKDFQAEAYRGTLNGQIFMESSALVPYSIDLRYKGVDLAQVRQINSGIFSQVDGHVDGHLQLKGDRRFIKNVEADVVMVDHGRVKASLLQPIVAYIPQGVQRKELETLINLDSFFVVETGTVHIRNISERQLSVVVVLESKKLNLNLNLPIDINLDVPMGPILKYLQNF